MKKGTILGLSLLALFILSSAGPSIISNIDVSAFSTAQPDIYTKEAVDTNGDKIDDTLLSSTFFTNGYSNEIAVKFTHPVSYSDIQKLNNIGAMCTDEIWDEGSRIKISASRDTLDVIAEFQDVSYITTTEIRHIMVVIDGSDFSDLNAVTAFDDSEIFWAAGCAVVRYYSGVENDIKQLGAYDIIADTTDIRFEIDAIKEDDIYQFVPDTLDNANTINVTQLQSAGYDGSGVKIGILDTGVRATHDDLSGRVSKQESFVLITYGYDFDDTTDDDLNGHGTHVAGIAAGDGTANAQRIGIAPEATIFAAKIGDWHEDTAPATLTSMVAGANWLANQGADVINLSFGTGSVVGSNVLVSAVNNIVNNKGVKFCTSNGNEGEEGVYTTNSPNSAISVGCADDTGSTWDLAYFTSQGPNGDNAMKPDVVAPGYQIASASNLADTAYNTYSGTSQASPQVAGACAVLIEYCKGNGLSFSPGTLKAALMSSAVLLTPLSTFELHKQGRGMINVGAAATLMKNAVKEGSNPLIGAINPAINPLSIFADLLQGQTIEQYLTLVSPFSDDNLTVEITGDAADLITIEEPTNYYTALAKITYSIPVDQALGSYDGLITFRYKTTILETAEIDINVVASHGAHRMLLNFRTTDWTNDHMYGQYKFFTEDLIAKGWAIGEQNVELNSTILANYEAVWFPDPFNMRSETGLAEDLYTWNPFTDDEITALNAFVAAGGSVFFDFLGHSTDADFPGVIFGTNVTHINDFTDTYGIHVRDDEWTSPSTIIVDPVGSHALTAGVTGVDHYGCSLATSGDAVQVTELTSGSPYSTLAYTQTASGGRVVVMSTNFALDTDGYRNKYSGVGTQNDIFGQNLVRWITSEHRIKQYNYTFSAGTLNMTYEYVSGPGADFGGYVITPSEARVNLTWTELSSGLWSATYNCEELGTYHFYPECGTTGVDEFDYILFECTETYKNGFSPIILISLSILGLAGSYMILRRRK